MRGAILVLALVLAAGCSESAKRGGEEPGTGGSGAAGSGGGGSGGTGGVDGSGGTGGTVSADTTPPTIDLQEPADASIVDNPWTTLRGLVTDEGGIASVRYIDGFGRAHQITGASGTEFPFEVIADLDEGDNEVQIEAFDLAGNKAEATVVVTWEDTPGRAPQIVSFTTSRPTLERGQEHLLSWRVSGSQPMNLLLYSVTGWYAVDVTGMTSLELPMEQVHGEMFVLNAENADGEAFAQLFVGVGDELVVWPDGVVIPPGTRQRLDVLNAASAEWTSDGGELAPLVLGYNSGTYFQASEPGTYTITAHSEDPVSRSASVTIRVQEMAAPRIGFRGIGGQIGDVDGYWDPTPVITPEGDLLLAASSWGFARYVASTEQWEFEGRGSTGTFEQIAAADDGTLFASDSATVHVRAPGAVSFEPIESGWSEPGYLGPLSVGRDGSLFVVANAWTGTSELWRKVGAQPFAQVVLPEGVTPRAVDMHADGRLVVAVAGENDALSVLEQDADDPLAWSDTGAVPEAIPELHDLLVGSDGSIYVAGTNAWRFDGAGWTALNAGLPVCTQGTICGVYDFHERRADGAILALSRWGVHELGSDDVFREFGIPSTSMQAGGFVRGTMRRLAETRDGTFFAVSDIGVFRLRSDSVFWSRLGAEGMAPTSQAHALVVRPDGTWILASGGMRGLEDSHSLFLRPSGREDWVGFGNEAPNGFDNEPDPIVGLGADEAGLFYGLTLNGEPFRLDLQTEAYVELPTPGFELAEPRAFGVAADGTIFVVTRDRVVRELRPGAAQWRSNTELDCAQAFVRDGDGNLWAASCPALGPMRRRRGQTRWEPAWAGLPTSLDSRHLAVDDGGVVYLASSAGTFRFNKGDSTWERFGTGEPSISAQRIAAGGGRVWAATGTDLYLLSEGGSWLPVGERLPFNASSAKLFQAAPDGSLLVSDGNDGIGLVQSFALP